MSVISQNERNENKGRNQQLSDEEYQIFIQKCTEKRNSKMAVSTKWAQNTIQKIKKKFNHEWFPCETTISNIFKRNGWKHRKSQKRSPLSDPDNKDALIQKFKNDLIDIIRERCLNKENIHIMDETGLYSDPIPHYTWTFKKDTEAYVCSSGVQRRDTLVATIRRDGQGFATFIEHQRMRTKNVNGEKIIIDKGTKGMIIIEMKKWCKQFIQQAKPKDVLIMDNLTS